MGRKAIIYCIAALCVLFALIAGAVVVLFSDSDEEAVSEELVRSQASSAHPLLNAVPSDAALILSCTGFKNALKALDDSTMLIGQMFTGDSGPFRSFLHKAAELSSKGHLGAMKNSGMSISVHFGGNAVPLLIVKTGRNHSDSTSASSLLIRAASALSLHTSVKTVDSEADSPLAGQSLLIVSPSESLVQSAERHVTGRTSILDAAGLSFLASSMRGGFCIFMDHDYSLRAAGTFLSGNYSGKAKFVNRYADWSGVSVDDFSEGSVSMSGKSFTEDDDTYYANVLAGLKPGNPGAQNILPDATRYMSSLSFDSFKEYVTAYRKYADASHSLNAFNSASASVKKSAGVLPDHWAESIGVKEVVTASVSCRDSVRNVVLLRVTKPVASLLFKDADASDMKSNEGKVSVCPYYRSTEILFGKLFAASDSTAMYTQGWMVFGHPEALSLFTPSKDRRNLAMFLKECGQEKLLKSDGAVFQSYFSFTPEMAGEWFRKDLSEAAGNALSGISFSPVAFSLQAGEEHGFTLDVRRVNVYSGGSDVSGLMPKDTVVNVPKGPFKVKNCGTGRMNLISQQGNNYIVLKELDGKGIWTVPFQAPICGAVREVGYFANGKIQFLFASGNSLYLIDRLGRFVKSFPVSVGKEILLGPDVYDFTGAKGYTAVVLHKDNTVGIYDLHGKPKDFWKGVTFNETIKSVPELISVKGKKYWITRTSEAAYIVPFAGGKPLTPETGNKRIKPGALVSVKEDGSVSAICIDGKERVVKLEK